MSTCSKCPTHVCRTGDTLHIPDNCPMQQDFPETLGFYSSPDILRVSQAAALVESTGYCRWTRVEEVMEFSRRAGIKKLGIAFCSGMLREAKALAGVLEANGFEVFSTACKTGGVPKEAIGILDSEKVRPGTVEPMCNPIAQAILLNRSGVELTILMGQCVGHDSLSIKHLEGWVTCLVTKDRVLAHNPIGAIYGAKGYFHRALYQNHKL